MICTHLVHTEQTVCKCSAELPLISDREVEAYERNCAKDLLDLTQQNASVVFLVCFGLILCIFCFLKKQRGFEVCSFCALFMILDVSFCSQRARRRKRRRRPRRTALRSRSRHNKARNQRRNQKRMYSLSEYFFCTHAFHCTVPHATAVTGIGLTDLLLWTKASPFCGSTLDKYWLLTGWSID